MFKFYISHLKSPVRFGLQISVILLNIHNLFISWKGFCRNCAYICTHYGCVKFMRLFRYLLFLLSFSLCSLTSGARTVHGYNIPEQVLDAKAKARFKKEMIAENPIMAAKIIRNAIERPHRPKDRSFDFLLLLLLVGTLAVFKFSNQGYFKNLFRAFRNQTLSARQLKEQISQNSVAGLVMDLLFCISMALYLYYAFAHLQHNALSRYSNGAVLAAIILLFGSIYVIRYLFLKFTGWVFNISEITDNYTFNVFLINKIMGILIIPFTVVLAFGQGAWVQVTLFLSLILIAILFLNRYLRSGVVFGYFIKFSKFHFFMYLCASELLPLAVLMKAIKQYFFS